MNAQAAGDLFQQLALNPGFEAIQLDYQTDSAPLTLQKYFFATSAVYCKELPLQCGWHASLTQIINFMALLLQKDTTLIVLIPYLFSFQFPLDLLARASKRPSSGFSCLVSYILSQHTVNADNLYHTNSRACACVLSKWTTYRYIHIHITSPVAVYFSVVMRQLQCNL